MRNRHGKVLSIGELIVDFVSMNEGASLRSTPAFKKCAGGAPANVAVGIARLGTHSAFIGRVGADPFGRFLKDELRTAGVEASGIVFDQSHKTRLAFVALGKDGDRSFEFWEKEPADERLQSTDIPRKILARTRIVNIGAFLLVRNPARRAAFDLARRARACGCDVCFDPNLRLSLWIDREEARRISSAMIQLATILRLNDTEAAFLTGRRNMSQAASRLRKLGPNLIAVTLGRRGCFFQTAEVEGYAPGFRVRAVDTTGCGDGFLAGFLDGLVRHNKPPNRLAEKELRGICRAANAVGALVALRHGAIDAMPSRSELLTFLRRRQTA